jgi:hypothetical protein
MTIRQAANKWKLDYAQVRSWVAKGLVPGASGNEIPDHIVAQGRPFPTGHFGKKFHQAHQDHLDSQVMIGRSK